MNIITKHLEGAPVWIVWSGIILVNVIVLFVISREVKKFAFDRLYSQNTLILHSQIDDLGL